MIAVKEPVYANNVIYKAVRKYNYKEHANIW